MKEFRSSEAKQFDFMAHQIDELAQMVIDHEDPKMLSDLRQLVKRAYKAERAASAESPEVAERSRRAKAAYHRAELAKLEPHE